MSIFSRVTSVFSKQVVIASLLSVATVASHANVVILGTRVIYPASASEVSVKLNNPDDKPSLVQAWIDKGEDGANTKAKTPFIVTPPLFRLDPKKGQNLRIIYNKEPLATDRETLYYLNVLDIPPKPSSKDPNAPSNYLQFSIRSKLKFFFRPANLPMAAKDAAKSIAWSVGKDDAGKPALVAENDSPFYISITEVTAGAAKVTNPQMMSPMSQMTFTLDQPVSAGAAVTFSHINDFGAKVEESAILK